MVKKAYSWETKLACIDMKKAGKSNRVIMGTLGIKNNSQIYTCLYLDEMVRKRGALSFSSRCWQAIYLR